MIRKFKMQKKNMSFWVAIILSVVAGASVFIALHQLYRPVKVIVPLKNITVGTQLQQTDIGLKTMSRRDMHRDTVTSSQNAVGKYTKDSLYANEPILSSKLIKEKENLELPAPGNIELEETYISFKASEAKWPSGLKEGNFVTIVGTNELAPKVLAEKVKVIDAPESKNTGQIGNIKTAVGAAENITLVLKWEQLGPLLDGREKSKELWIVPEHPDKESGVFLFPRIIEQALEGGAN